MGPSSCKSTVTTSGLLLCVVVSFLAELAHGHGERLVPALYVLGDSQADVGNNNQLELSPLRANFPRNGIDYPGQQATGRFSNGYNLADHLAQELGFAESPPPFLSLSNASQWMSKGINFASGGSGLLPKTGNGKACTQVLSIAEQVGNFTNLARQWASGDNRSADVLSKSLFFISAGSNDLFEYIDIGPQYNDTDLLQSLVASYSAYLRDLYGAGARKFSVVGTSLVGCCPSQRFIAHNLQDPKASDKHGCLAALNNLSSQLSPMFAAMLQDLSGELPGMNYSLADSIKMVEFVLENPSTPSLNYTFTVLDTACCGGGQFGAEYGCNFSAPLCPNRSNHLFWDDYHPTEALSQLAAKIIFGDPSRLYVHPINVQQLVGGGAATLENI